MSTLSSRQVTRAVQNRLLGHTRTSTLMSPHASSILPLHAYLITRLALGWSHPGSRVLQSPKDSLVDPVKHGQSIPASTPSRHFDHGTEPRPSLVNPVYSTDMPADSLVFAPTRPSNMPRTGGGRNYYGGGGTPSDPLALHSRNRATGGRGSDPLGLYGGPGAMHPGYRNGMYGGYRGTPSGPLALYSRNRAVPHDYGGGGRSPDSLGLYGGPGAMRPGYRNGMYGSQVGLYQGPGRMHNGQPHTQIINIYPSNPTCQNCGHRTHEGPARVQDVVRRLGYGNHVQLERIGSRPHARKKSGGRAGGGGRREVTRTIPWWMYSLT